MFYIIFFTFICCVIKKEFFLKLICYNIQTEDIDYIIRIHIFSKYE